MNYRMLKGMIILTVLAMAVTLSAIVTMILSPYEIARVRNSLIAEVGTEQDVRWIPTAPPQGYLVEKSSAPPEFSPITKEIFSGESSIRGNWERSLKIATHLASGPGVGEGIMSSTYDTYRTIVSEQAGYCADYTQVFNGLAIAAGIPVREWGVSFDGFSGRGHALNEIYDDRLGKWVLIDSFYSLYVKDADTGEPLSVLEFRDRLRNGLRKEQILVEPIVPRRFGFKDEKMALDYFGQGADQFYLWFGNNVFSYDSHLLVRLFGPLSRALEQASAILVGIHPGIRILETPTNRTVVAELFEVRNRFILEVLVLMLLGLAFIVELAVYRRTRTDNGL